MRRSRRTTFGLEQGGQHSKDVGLIVDEEDTGRHDGVLRMPRTRNEVLTLGIYGERNDHCRATSIRFTEFDRTAMVLDRLPHERQP